MAPAQFEEMLVRHEGMELKPYVCPAGKLTVGIGRNLEDRGMTEAEARYLLRNDISQAKAELERAFPIVSTLDSVRYYALLNMAFNMGVQRLGSFHRMWDAVEKRDWDKAADEMLDSLWARQVKRRAVELSEMMRTGSYTY